MNRIRLVGVALALVALGASAAGCESSEHKAARQDAHDQAAIYCTLEGIVPGMTGLDDPAYLACVKREAKINLAEWESAH